MSNRRSPYFSPYISFTRKEWSQLRDAATVDLLEKDVEQLKSMNEPLTLEEVTQVYLPLSRLLNLYVTASQHLYAATDQFLGSKSPKVPYIIGIAGSVAVGKSTTARVLKRLLSMWENHPKVELVTTDGFLYPNRILEERGLMQRKGFPESYDIRKLIGFLADVKSGKERIAAPVYSHLYYDVTSEVQWIEQPDILLIEGVNVLQARDRGITGAPRIFVSDFFDFSIYVHAEVHHIARWYIERFETLRQTAFQNPSSFFHRYAHLTREESMTIASEIWNNINQPNLLENILPTRYRASLVLEKGADHFVEKVQLRKI